jgi:hypothetical protein
VFYDRPQGLLVNWQCIEYAWREESAVFHLVGSPGDVYLNLGDSWIYDVTMGGRRLISDFIL